MLKACLLKSRGLKFFKEMVALRLLYVFGDTSVIKKQADCTGTDGGSNVCFCPCI